MGFSLKDARTIRMHSRSVYAFTIKDRNDRNIAVIVFESTNQRAANVNILRNAVNVEYRHEILSCLDALSFIEPSIDIARSKGF